MIKYHAEKVKYISITLCSARRISSKCSSNWGPDSNATLHWLHFQVSTLDEAAPRAGWELESYTASDLMAIGKDMEALDDKELL